MEVYEATEDDLWTLTAAGEVFHAESPVYKTVPFVKQEAAAYIYSHIHDENKCCFIAKNEEGMVGAVLGMYAPIFFGLELHAHEETLYCLPDERGTHAGSALMQRFVDWAEEKGCKRIWTGSQTGINTYVYVQIVQKLGFELSGQVFYRDGRSN